jgi:hypothetical protein
MRGLQSSLTPGYDYARRVDCERKVPILRTRSGHIRFRAIPTQFESKQFFRQDLNYIIQ